MTFAPAPLLLLSAYWREQGGVPLGVVGDARHQTRASYHNGQDAIQRYGRTCRNDYSICLPRDREPHLTNAAAAIDLGRLHGSLRGLRDFSNWLVAECLTNAAKRYDVREIIYSPDGKVVQRYSGPQNAVKVGGTPDHLTHTHISYYRDSERRRKVPLFEPYFNGAEADMILFSTGGKLRVFAKGTPIFDKPDGAQVGTIASASTVYALRAQDAAEDEAVKWYLIDGGGDEKAMRWVKAA